MSSASKICIDPQVMLGKPVIRGTRVTVELVLRKLSEGAKGVGRTGDDYGSRRIGLMRLLADSVRR